MKKVILVFALMIASVSESTINGVFRYSQLLRVVSLKCGKEIQLITVLPIYKRLLGLCATSPTTLRAIKQHVEKDDAERWKALHGITRYEPTGWATYPTEINCLLSKITGMEPREFQKEKINALLRHSIDKEGRLVNPLKWDEADILDRILDRIIEKQT